MNNYSLSSFKLLAILIACLTNVHKSFASGIQCSSLFDIKTQTISVLNKISEKADETIEENEQTYYKSNYVYAQKKYPELRTYLAYIEATEGAFVSIFNYLDIVRENGPVRKSSQFSRFTLHNSYYWNMVLDQIYQGPRHLFFWAKHSELMHDKNIVHNVLSALEGSEKALDDLTGFPSTYQKPDNYKNYYVPEIEKLRTKIRDEIEEVRSYL
jgi:hypothetical protein